MFNIDTYVESGGISEYTKNSSMVKGAWQKQVLIQPFVVLDIAVCPLPRVTFRFVYDILWTHGPIIHAEVI